MEVVLGGTVALSTSVVYIEKVTREFFFSKGEILSKTKQARVIARIQPQYAVSLN